MKEVQRTFIPGSEWIYIKVYTGSNTADKMLVNELSKFISALSRKKYIEKMVLYSIFRSGFPSAC